MIKKLLLLLLLTATLLPSSFKNDDSYTLNLIFKEINVKSGDKVFFEGESNLVGSVVSNKISNHYNIVKIKLSNDIKIPTNSKFEHIFAGALKKNAINITPANDIGSYKNTDIIIVDFKGIVTICDRVDSVKVVFDQISNDLTSKKSELKELNEKIVLRTKDYWEIEQTIEALNKTYQRIDSMVTNKKEERNKEIKILDLKISKLKSNRDSLKIDVENITKNYNDYNTKVENLLELISNKTSEKKLLLEDIKQKNINLTKLNNEYESAAKKLADTKNQYSEIISFVKENIVVIKEYDVAPMPRNGKTIQEIINTNLPEKLRGKYKGYVVVEIFINDKGVIQAIKDIVSYPDNNISPDIEEVCLNEMQAIKWNPATKDNKKVGVSYKVVFNFE